MKICNDACGGVSGSCTCVPNEHREFGQGYALGDGSYGFLGYQVVVDSWVEQYLLNHPYKFKNLCHKTFQESEDYQYHFYLIQKPDSIESDGILSPYISYIPWREDLCRGLVGKGIYIGIIPLPANDNVPSVGPQYHYNFITLNNDTIEKGDFMNFYCDNVYQG